VGGGGIFGHQDMDIFLNFRVDGSKQGFDARVTNLQGFEGLGVTRIKGVDFRALVSMEWHICSARS
jgi:hypothetical protein